MTKKILKMRKMTIKIAKKEKMKKEIKHDKKK